MKNLTNFGNNLFKKPEKNQVQDESGTLQPINNNTSGSPIPGYIDQQGNPGSPNYPMLNPNQNQPPNYAYQHIPNNSNQPGGYLTFVPNNNPAPNYGYPTFQNSGPNNNPNSNFTPEGSGPERPDAKKGTFAMLREKANNKLHDVQGQLEHNEMYQKGSGAFNDLTKELKMNVGSIKEDIKNSINSQVRDFIDTQKEKLNQWIRIKIEQAIIKLLEKVRPELKKELKDPYMWGWVKDLVDDVIDEIWPEIQQEILWQISLKLDEPYVYDIPKKEIPCCLVPFHYIRAWYLYTTMPVDKTFWHMIRSPSWWFLLLLSACPYYGVQPFFFVVVFLMIDKSDEFQLVHYILQFKKMQFLTGGIVQGIIGYLFYFSCANMHNYQDSNSQNLLYDCTQNGPGTAINTYVDIPAFFSQLVFIWLAFFLLPFSAPKGRPKFRYQLLPDTNQKAECCCCTIDHSRGGRLKVFMLYDIMTFIAAVVIFILCVYVGGAKYDWQVKATYYFAKIIYGMLSLPWLVFAFPMIPAVLTKSRATAYDKDGNCVPILKTTHIPEDDERDYLLGRKGKGIEELFA